MSNAMMIIIGLAVLALIIAVVLAAGDSKPRITRIDRTTDHDKPRDGDDA